MIYIFANRKKCQSLWACLVSGLKMLESRITAIVLNGKVGQVNPVLPLLHCVNRSMKLEPEIEKSKKLEPKTEETITANVLKGKMRQVNLVEPSLQGVKRPMEFEPEIEEAAVQASNISKNGNHRVATTSRKCANPKQKAGHLGSKRIEETKVQSAGSSKDGNHGVARRSRKCTQSKKKAGKRTHKDAK